VRRRFSLEGRLAGAAFAAALLSAALLAVFVVLGLPLALGLALAAASGLAAAIGGTSWAWRPAGDALRGIADGVRGFQENDFGFRLAEGRDDEVGELTSLFNRMGDVLRTERRETFEREILLDAVLQGAPMAILLLNGRDRVVYANGAARRMFSGRGRLVGVALPEVEAPAAVLREALLAGEDATVTGRVPGREEETWRVAVRAFHFHAQRHRLFVVETTTGDVRRQELDAWRKVIRVVSHEVNNSLAPVSSLVHSARLAASSPRHAGRLEDILATIDERVRHLSRFLEGYAALARIPAPAPEAVEWATFLESVRRAVPFRILGGSGPACGIFDPAQIQQVLLNLLKNASEAGSPPGTIEVSVDEAAGGESILRVLDRGTGMDEDAMRRAALPLSSAARGGRGLGLPLCAEILAAHGGTLTLGARPGGGTVATCTLPRRAAPRAAAVS
jgi:nitrogen fixation/metabolism regulation signal transduction histidine kinase